MSEYAVVEATPKIVPLIPPLLYRGFGYTFSDPAMYSSESITAMIESGKHVFLVALDSAGQARGLVAMNFRYPTSQLTELCKLIVDPALSGPVGGQILRLLAIAVGEKGRELSRERGLRAFVTQLTTIHKLSQRLTEQMGFATTGLMLGVVPAWAERVRLLPDERMPSLASGGESRANFRRNRRRTETVSVRPFLKLCKPYTVTLPERFAALLMLLYEGMQLPVTFAAPVAPRGASTLVEQLDLGRSHAMVELTHVGTDAANLLLNRLMHYRDGMVDLIHFMLPLSGPNLDRTLDALLKSGCRYAALIPFYRDYDVLVLQYLNNVETDLCESDLFSPVARMLFRDVLQLSTNSQMAYVGVNGGEQ